MKKKILHQGGSVALQLNTSLGKGHFLDLAGSLNDTLLVYDFAGGDLLYINHSEFLGYTAEDMGPSLTFIEAHLHPEDRQSYRKCVADLKITGGETLNLRFKNKVGAWEWLEARCVFLKNTKQHAGPLLALIFSVRTIQKRIEILEIDRAHSLEMIARDWQMEAILYHMVQSISHQMEEACPAILIQSDKCLCHAAASNLLNETFIHSLDLLFQNGSYGLWQTALSERQTIWSEDVAQDDNWGIFKQHLLSGGITSVFLMPVQSGDGSTVGLIVLYFKHKAPPRERLVEVCESFANLISLVMERHHFTDMLYRQAMFDTLTSLPNRHLLEDNLRQVLFNARRRNQNFALVLINLDNFENIKETLGYFIGEELLRLVSDRLIHFVGENNRLAHTKEASFAVVLENLLDRSDAIQLIRQITALLKPIFRVGDNDLYLEISVGFSVFPRDGEDVATMFKNAEMALSFPSIEGPEKVNGYEPQMDTIARERLRITTQLRKAADQGDFILFYQPQVDLVTHRIIGFEALIRWKSPEYGMVPPVNFIHVAEVAGLIVPIGDWVLNEACRQQAAWRKEGRPDVRMAINVSPVQFTHPEFIIRLKHAIDQYQIPPDKFAIEITEGFLDENFLELVVLKLNQIRSMGIEVHIDDFGTGYSPISYLRKLPINCLKIDKFFVDALLDLEEDQIDTAAIPRAMITLGHGHKLSVLAEGVETIEQVNILKGMHCDHAQGYFFSRPQPADKIWQAVSAIEENWRKDELE
jgi:diguanylate cyclase (GGDEF)-like protein